MSSNTALPGRVSLPLNADKIRAQLKQLSLEEKVSLLAGSGFATTCGIPRLQIPSMRLAEGVNGVKDALAIDSGDTVADVLAGGGPTTICFPSTSCFGATWNSALMTRLGEALGSQARAKEVATIMGPGVNLHRDPRCGRNFEYFSEDPFLTGALAGAMINGIQKQGVGACAKHFVANDAENHRRQYNVVDPSGGRALRELYLAAFQEVLAHSNPVAIMTSYNKVEGFHTSETPLLEQVIRGEWGYDGAIQSDWFGTVSTVPSILAGQDLEMPGPSIFRGARLTEAVKDGLVPLEAIDKSATKMLEWIDKVTAEKAVVSLTEEESIKISREVASEGIVLLKNEDNALPLDASSTEKIAVIGLQAINPPVGGGGSSLAPPQYIRRPYESLKTTHSNPDLVRLAPGVRCNKLLPLMPTKFIQKIDGQSGVKIVYFNNSSPDQPVFEEYAKSTQVMMLGHLKPGLDEAGGFRYEITTQFVPETSGEHIVGVRSTGAYELLINGEQLLSSGSPTCTAEDFLFTPSKLEKRVAYRMIAGQAYNIRVVAHNWISGAQKANEPSPNFTELCFQTEDNDAEAIAEAVSLARDSDVSVVFVGRNSEYESEGSDMENISLPGKQEQLISAVAAASKRTIVVLNSGGPLDVSTFVDSVQAVVHAHYLGQEVGNAVADVIYGRVNPSGRLATTWPRRLEEHATFKHFPAAKAADGRIELSLIEGTGVGYRRNWADISPRYRFGFGLSYTEFRYGELAIRPTILGTIEEGAIATVSVNLTNAGEVAGADVVQVYVRREQSSVSTLRGFTKVFLEPGSSTEAKIDLDLRRTLSSWNIELQKWEITKGTYIASIGGHRDLEVTITVKDDQVWVGL